MVIPTKRKRDYPNSYFPAKSGKNIVMTVVGSFPGKEHCEYAKAVRL
jgi:hypothetical protein